MQKLLITILLLQPCQPPSNPSNYQFPVPDHQCNHKNLDIYILSLGGNNESHCNPIKSFDKLQVLSKRQSVHVYYFKFGKSKFSTFCKVLDGEVWIKLLTIQPNNIKPLGELIDKKFQDKFIDIATIIQLLKMGKDIGFSNSWHNFSTKQSWILRDFTIGQHTSSTLSKEEQFLNYISGKTPTGYEWDQNIPDGFMQISGNFDTFGDKDQRQINFCNQEPFYIQRNSLATVQIGVKNNEKWIVKFKQDNDLLHCREEQLPAQYNWPLTRSTWLRIY